MITKKHAPPERVFYVKIIQKRPFVLRTKEAFLLELVTGIGPVTSSLPMTCSTD